MVTWAHTSVNPRPHVDRFSRFAGFTNVTDTHTHISRHNGRVYAVYTMRPNNYNSSYHINKCIFLLNFVVFLRIFLSVICLERNFATITAVISKGQTIGVVLRTSSRVNNCDYGNKSYSQYSIAKDIKHAATRRIAVQLSLIHIWRCRRIERCRSRWSPYH